MWKILVLCLFLGACRNEAITYAHRLDECAQCDALFTAYLSDSPDTATCRTFNAVWLCKSGAGPNDPECKVIKELNPLHDSIASCYTRNGHGFEAR